jgi:hypothetical protein
MVESFVIDLPLEDAGRACEAALTRFGWKLRSAGPSEFVISRGSSWRKNAFSTTIAARLSQSGSQTAVTLKGRISGNTLTQDHQLREYFEQIRSDMQRAERDASTALSTPAAAPIDEDKLELRAYRMDYAKGGVWHGYNDSRRNRIAYSVQHKSRHLGYVYRPAKGDVHPAQGKYHALVGNSVIGGYKSAEEAARAVARASHRDQT